MIPTQIRNRLLERRRIAILKRGDERHLPDLEPGRSHEIEERAASGLGDRAIGRHRFDEDDQRLLRCQVYENDIRQELVGLDLEAEGLGQLVVPLNDLIPRSRKSTSPRGLQGIWSRTLRPRLW